LIISFGILVSIRNGGSDDYRYGFNGMEKDDEVKGSGNSINYKYRMRDRRVGRFFRLIRYLEIIRGIVHMLLVRIALLIL